MCVLATGNDFCMPIHTVDIHYFTKTNCWSENSLYNCLSEPRSQKTRTLFKEMLAILECTFDDITGTATVLKLISDVLY